MNNKGIQFPLLTLLQDPVSNPKSQSPEIYAYFIWLASNLLSKRLCTVPVLQCGQQWIHAQRWLHTEPSTGATGRCQHRLPLKTSRKPREQCRTSHSRQVRTVCRRFPGRATCGKVVDDLWKTCWRFVDSLISVIGFSLSCMLKRGGCVCIALRASRIYSMTAFIYMTYTRENLYILTSLIKVNQNSNFLFISNFQ